MGRKRKDKKRNWQFRQPGIVQRVHGYLGWTYLEAASCLVISEATYGRMMRISNGDDPKGEIPLDLEQVRRWRDIAITQIDDEDLKAELVDDQLLEFDKPRMFRWSNPIPRPRVALVQAWSYHEQHREIELAFFREALRRGWNSSVLRANLQNSCEELVCQAAGENHVVVHLPTSKAVTEMIRLSREGKVVVGCGLLEPPSQVYTVRVTSDQYAERMWEMLKDAGHEYHSMLCLFGPDAISVERLAALEARGLIPENPLPIPAVVSYRGYVDAILERLKPSTNSRVRTAILPLHRAFTLACVGALERLGWPESLHLFSSDLNSDWLHIFDSQPTWQGSIIIDNSLLMEVAGGIVTTASEYESLLKHQQSRHYNVDAVALTRKDRATHGHLSYSELVETIRAAQLKGIRKPFPWLVSAQAT